MDLDWWQWALTLVTVGVVVPVFSLVLNNWWARRKQTRKVLTEDAFKRVFNESILPDLERSIKDRIEGEIRARVHARYLIGAMAPNEPAR